MAEQSLPSLEGFSIGQVVYLIGKDRSPVECKVEGIERAFPLNEGASAELKPNGTHNFIVVRLPNGKLAGRLAGVYPTRQTALDSVVG